MKRQLLPRLADNPLAVQPMLLLHCCSVAAATLQPHVSYIALLVMSLCTAGAIGNAHNCASHTGKGLQFGVQDPASLRQR